MANIQEKEPQSHDVIYHLWRNDAFTRFRPMDLELITGTHEQNSHSNKNTSEKQRNDKNPTGKHQQKPQAKRAKLDSSDVVRIRHGAFACVFKSSLASQQT